jgi:hypothetical protein
MPDDEESNISAQTTNEQVVSNGTTDAPEISPEIRAKQESARKLRMIFSPPEMLDDNGNISQQYFRPSRQLFNQNAIQSIRWAEAQDLALLYGIAKHGLRDWSAIILEFLPNWVRHILY